VLAATTSLAAVGEEQPATPVSIQILLSPPAVASKELMNRWHRDYRGRISPVLREWRSLAQAVHERPRSWLTAGCRSLDLALNRLSGAELPIAPDPSVSFHLEEALRSLTKAAESCTQGAYFLTAWRLQQADDSWRELRGRLLLYGLAP
jgi:hypothetical protein